ncbi:MAG: prepilin peptidase [Chelatococcus sp.]|uniref:A24 family peptidase n=2 Tax=Chelatococcus TaxID=28209 RepID=UPI001BCD6A72|nr:MULTISPECIES: prepilin peptidase [unclassified Chelatococcus]CAH1662105.1 Type IV prepilin peptidase TadV/CpaA [Hyphomicrobiales bacterium]MBS7741346.1 prepilin peptidase [Chelatococcus sp. HY11]MBX3536862.1 prepilin peptidase [Chelatococcus sp.]MBX3546172.1 prepilin peptidase [Chelatococcus sp.]CAH1682835.1 Type IV prepilin peptidase TadV/CpaA [Hyphomicrobiales bacterium]
MIMTLLILFPFLMILAAVNDIMTMTIPNFIPLVLIVGFSLFAPVAGLSATTIGLHATAAVLMLAVTFCFFACGWIGGGDAKLAAATALWFGPTMPLLDYAVLTSLIGAGLTLALLVARRMPLPVFAEEWAWARRLHGAGTGVPYGMALATAGLIIYPDSAIWKATMLS